MNPSTPPYWQRKFAHMVLRLRHQQERHLLIPLSCRLDGFLEALEATGVISPDAHERLRTLTDDAYRRASKDAYCAKSGTPQEAA